MTKALLFLLDWSEVWAPLIPLAYFLFHREQPRYMRPVIAYVFLALFLNLAIDLISELKPNYIPESVSNNPLYNIHSILRFICFAGFFTLLGQRDFAGLRKAIPILSLAIITVNFLFFEHFWNPDRLSGNLLATEAYLLLVYCMLYYLSKLRDDGTDFTATPDFWVVTGLAIYVVVNFFVFLFYVPMIEKDLPLALNIWNLHNIAYIIFCIFITRALYGSTRYQFAG